MSGPAIKEARFVVDVKRQDWIDAVERSHASPEAEEAAWKAYNAAVDAYLTLQRETKLERWWGPERYREPM